MYPPEAIPTLWEQQEESFRSLGRLVQRVVSELAPTLQVQEAREFALHGVSRRLGIIQSCVRNIFLLYPPERTERLDRDALQSVNINLHAMLVNVSGLQDNWAWVYVLEQGVVIGKRFRRSDVGLYQNRTQALLPLAVTTYLNEPTMIQWRDLYAKEYRDSIAHRVPLYVPPSNLSPADLARHGELGELMNAHNLSGDIEAMFDALRERNNLGSASPLFLNSITVGRPLLLHPQIICDAMTVAEISEIMLANPPVGAVAGGAP